MFERTLKGHSDREIILTLIHVSGGVIISKKTVGRDEKQKRQLTFSEHLS